MMTLQMVSTAFAEHNVRTSSNPVLIDWYIFFCIISDLTIVGEDPAFYRFTAINVLVIGIGSVLSITHHSQEMMLLWTGGFKESISKHVICALSSRSTYIINRPFA